MDINNAKDAAGKAVSIGDTIELATLYGRIRVVVTGLRYSSEQAAIGNRPKGWIAQFEPVQIGPHWPDRPTLGFKPISEWGFNNSMEKAYRVE